MKIGNLFSKSASCLTVIALLLLLIAPSFAIAGTITTASDTMSRQKANTASDHTILFVTPTGVASGGIITLTFSTGFTGIGSMVGADFDFATGDSGVCSTANFTEQLVVDSAPSASQFSVHGSGQVVTITSGGASATVTAGRCVRLKAGLTATSTQGSGPGSHQITNGATGGTDTIAIAGSFGDTGTISDEIDTDDSVPITATVNQSISFSLNVALTNTGGVQAVALGTLTTAAASGSSDASGTIYPIWANISSNSSGGSSVSVVSAKGALKSTAVSTDTIPSATATMTAGTANYGICIKSVSQTSGATLTKGANFNGATCTNTPTGNTVGALTTSAQSLLTAATPINAGVGEIMVDAENSAITPAHSDYSDTLTFIATSTF